jgi:hypothetical protein
VGRGAGGAAEFLEGTAFDHGDGRSDFPDKSRFITLAAIGNGSEVGAVRFEHELPERRGGDDITDVLPVFVRKDTGETDDGPEVDDALPYGRAFRKAMKHALHAAGKGSEQAQRVFESGALVNDYIEASLSGQFEVLFKKLSLPLFDWRGDHRVLRESEIIEACFAQRDDLGMLAQVTEFVRKIGGSVHDFTWMPASHGIDGVESICEGNCATTALEVGADGNDPGDASGSCALHGGGDFLREVGIIEMSVGIVKHLAEGKDRGNE